MKLWGFELDDDQLTDEDRAYLAGLPERLPDVQWVWAELDRVWYSLGLDNRRPLGNQQEAVAAFYSHPVWTMNGVFTATDPDSQGHRRAIASYLADADVGDIADYGGGFGQLALQIVEASGTASVTIVEPFASDTARDRFAGVDRVDLVTSLEDVEVEAIIAQDVLEHVDDPIGLAMQMAGHVRDGGRLIFANHFRPSIACHLPATFHLLHTFPWVMRALGLRFEGVINDAPHAQVFELAGPLRPRRALIAERISRIVAPLLEFARRVLPASLKRRLRGRR